MCRCAANWNPSPAGEYYLSGGFWCWCLAAPAATAGPMGVEGVMTVVPQGIIGTEANPGPEAWSPRFLPRCEAEANLGPFAGGCRAIEIRCGHPALPAAQGPGVGSDRWCIPMMTCRKSPETATGRAGSSSPLDGDDNGDREDSREQKTPRLVVPCLSV